MPTNVIIIIKQTTAAQRMATLPAAFGGGFDVLSVMTALPQCKRAVSSVTSLYAAFSMTEAASLRFVVIKGFAFTNRSFSFAFKLSRPARFRDAGRKVYQ